MIETHTTRQPTCVARWRDSRWFAPGLYVAVAAVLYTLGVLALTSVAHWYSFHDTGQTGAASPWYHGPHWLSGWARFDAGWYRSIADHGYFFRGKLAQSSVAFFPLYPLLTRWLSHAFGGDPSAWGVLITFVSGGAALMLFARWVSSRLDPPAARTAIAVMALWPFALYLYGAVYADALFVMLTLAAFTCVERDRVILAAAFGALATATRPVGAALVLGLVLRVVEQRGVVHVQARAAGRRVTVNLQRLRRSDPVILASAAGLLAYMGYLWHRFNDPFAFSTAEAAPGWDQQPGVRVWFKSAWFSRLIHLPGSGPRYFAVVTLQAFLMVGLVVLIPTVVRRFGWAYGFYTAALLAIPLVGSKDFQGLGRYALGAFPAFAVFGEKLSRHRSVRRVWFAGAFMALCFFSASFARGGYVA